jgi:hypothetical protein
VVNKNSNPSEIRGNRRLRNTGGNGVDEVEEDIDSKAASREAFQRSDCMRRNLAM